MQFLKVFNSWNMIPINIITRDTLREPRLLFNRKTAYIKRAGNILVSNFSMRNNR